MCSLHTIAVMRKTVYALTIVGLGLSPAVALALLYEAVAAPLVIYNPSPSEPKGLYRLADATPVPGLLVAFHVPAPGRAYAGAYLSYLMRNPILKEVAAGPGSIVCEHDGAVFIDGARRGLVALQDRHGHGLPHWSGCHQLASGELFAFSNRIPNSFDSRYYGPVLARDVVGVYAPIWTE